MAGKANNQRSVMMAGLTRRVRPRLRKIARLNFESAKIWFLNAVENHHVSQDILSHAESPLLNYSQGTLFGFLGFNQGDDPISKLLQVLDSKITYQEAAMLPKNSLYSVIVKFPSKSDLIGAGVVTPWDSSRPWVSAIEDGISGLPYYLNKSWGGSKSGEGFQVKRGAVRSSEFTGISYLTPLISQFRKRLLIK